MVLVIVMKFAIPNPTYPAVTSPLGTSSVFESAFILNNKTFGVVPNDDLDLLYIKDLIDQAFSSKVHYPDKCLFAIVGIVTRGLLIFAD